MSRTLRNFLPLISFLVLLVGVFLPMGMTAATYDFIYALRVFNNSTTYYLQVPILITVNSAQLHDYRYMDADALDTNVLEGSTSLPYSIASYRLGAFFSYLGGGQVRNLDYYLNYNPERTSFPIMVGGNGNVSVADASAIDPGWCNYTQEVGGGYLYRLGYGENLLDESNMLMGKANVTRVDKPAPSYVRALSYSSSIHPVSYTDASSEWTNEANAYDYSVGTGALSSAKAASQWTGYLGLNLSASMPINAVRFSTTEYTTPGYWANVSVDVWPTGGSSWTTAYNGTAAIGSWDTKHLGSLTFVDAIRLCFQRNATVGTVGLYLNELEVSGYVEEVRGIDVWGNTTLKVETWPQLCSNADFEVGGNLTTIPTGWTNGGGVANVVGKNTTVMKTGTYSLRQRVNDPGGTTPTFSYFNISGTNEYAGQRVTWGAWCYAPTTNDKDQAISVWDGVSASFSSYVPRDGAWHWMNVTKTLSSSATCLYVRSDSKASAAADADDVLFTDGGVCVIGTTIPTHTGWPYNVGVWVAGALQNYTYCPWSMRAPNDSSNWMLYPYSYWNSYKLTVNGTQRVWFEPNTMITEPILTDRQGGDNNGTISWGANPAGIEVTVGELSSYISTESGITTSNEAVPDLLDPFPNVPQIPTPTDSDLVGMPLFVGVNRTAHDMGMSVRVAYVILMWITCMVLGVAGLVALGSSWGFVGGYGAGSALALGTPVWPQMLVITVAFVLILGVFLWRSH